MAEQLKSLVLEGVNIMFRNFSGKEGKFNAEGKRNFCVFLDPEKAESMEKDGWAVRYLQPREAEDDPQAYLQVALNFKNRPPRLVMLTSRGKTMLDEGMVNILDWAEIVKTDLIIRPYQWEVNGKSGVKAYLKALYATIYEDELELKYVDVPDTAMNTLIEEDDDPWDDEK